MKKSDNQDSHINSAQGQALESHGNLIPHHRPNPITGELDWFVPQEIKEPADEELARLRGFEIGWTKYGFRTIRAAMIPCRLVARDANGNEYFIDTPSEIQHQRYCAIMGDEWKEQDAAKQAGRCQIPDGRGGVKRCPTRIPNPTYVPGGDMPKTLPISCIGCNYEPYKSACTIVTFSNLESSHLETGDEIPFEAVTPDLYNEADRYMRLSPAFVDFVRTRAPELVGLASMLTREYSRSDAARMLGIPTSTAGSQKQRLMKLLLEFLDNCFIP